MRGFLVGGLGVFCFVCFFGGNLVLAFFVIIWAVLVDESMINCKSMDVS